jgi:preprotein translocase subunit YajC
VNQLLPIVIIAALFIGLIAFNRRNRDRASRADSLRRERLHPGAQVMTTSGLYGTVVAVDRADDTAQVSIAPGVEVKWTIAALREVSELPGKYQGGVDYPGGAPGEENLDNGSEK